MGLLKSRSALKLKRFILSEYIQALDGAASDSLRFH